MFNDAEVFSGFSVNDLPTALAFYREKLDIDVTEVPGMGLTLNFNTGGSAFVYEKPDHTPATFTILNFSVEDIDGAVNTLSNRGIIMERYDNLPSDQDEMGILRGKAAQMGPDIAWFKDPAGNILAVLSN
jgi:catechol 2,3-dioxygenase-like lactoylglutathione lyase family enzyme